ncbi:MAG: hypothetical protein ACKKL6_00705 [Candidatus Komeilibacteria bacterium]
MKRDAVILAAICLMTIFFSVLGINHMLENTRNIQNLSTIGLGCINVGIALAALGRLTKEGFSY